MNDALFCTNFLFNEICFRQSAHRGDMRGAKLHYIGMIKHGAGRLVSQGKVLELKEGELFYIPKGCRYRSHWLAEDYVCFDSIGFLYFPTQAANGYKLQKIPYEKSIYDAFAPLSMSKAVNAASIGTLYQLLGKLEKVMEPAEIQKEFALYEKASLLMQENPQLQIPEYAALCGVSDSQFYHAVKKATNKTPNRIRQEILCRKAANLLIATTYTVEEICDQLGFSSSSYFRKIFESVYEKSPSQIRKEQRGI